jgi:hypothetical protein
MAHFSPRQQCRRQPGEAAAAEAQAVQHQGTLCQVALGVSTVVQKFAAAQGIPALSFCHSSTVPGTYTPGIVAALLPPYLAHVCTAIEGTAATASVTTVHFTPSAVGPPPPRMFNCYQRHSNLSLLCLIHHHRRKAHTSI